MSMTVCATCGRGAPPACRMCGRPMVLLCDEADLREAGWREDGERWKQPLDRLKDEEVVRVADKITYCDLTGKEKSREPQWVRVDATPDDSMSTESACRAEMMHRHGPARTETVVSRQYTDAECDAVAAMAKSRSGDFLAQAKQMRAAMVTTGWTQCVGCLAWPDGTPDAIKDGKTLLPAS